MDKLKVVSLFSGIGAFEKALTNIKVPIEVVGFSEIDKWAATSYSAIHGLDESLNTPDVRDVDGALFGEVDLLTHGSPCQSFSDVNLQVNTKGGNEGSGTVSSLMWETVRVVKECLPKVVIWENVQAVLGPRNKHNFDRYISELADVGYKSFFQKVNTKDFNVAQNRPRVFVVSVLDHSIDLKFPEPVKLTNTLGDYLEEAVDEKYIVPEEVVRNFYTKTQRGSSFTRKLEVKPLDSIAYCLVAKGGRSVVTNNYVYNDLSLYENNPYDRFEIGKMLEDGIKIRSLTPLEYWRLQTFDDEDFYKAKEALNNTYHKGKDKSDAQLYKQAGNSITVKVAEEIFKELYGVQHD